MNKKVLLIDGNSFCYRAFYAIKSLATSKGIPTNAIFGFITMLNRLISQQKPDYLAVAFDLKGPTFRHKMFTDYKIQRKPMPDDLSAQIPTIKKILAAYRISIFEKKGYEADDIIATLAKKLDKAELEVLIVTSDKDILQVVTDNVKVLNPHKDGLILDEAWVRKRYGVGPEKIAEIMALGGDTSDNIPGVPGIGEATAIELIKSFGTLDGVLANVNRIANKARGEKIKEFAEQARMSKELARLDFNVPPLAKRAAKELLEQLKMGEADREKLLEIFRELEFKSLLRSLISESKDKIDCQIVSEVEGVEKFIKQASEGKAMAVYVETDHQEPMRANLLGASCCLQAGKAFFFSFKKFPPSTLKPLLENKDVKKLGHDLKYLKIVLSNYGIDLQGISFDTMVAAYLLNPEETKYALADLALDELNCKLEQEHSPDTERKAAEIYPQFAEAIFRLSKILQKQLKEKGLLELFENIEMPLIEVLADMEKEGVSLDKDFLLHLSRDFDKKLKSLTREIYEMVGGEFNINSPKQLSSILFEKLKLPRIKRTKTGSSTDTEVLQKLSTIHPVAAALLEFREISKLKSTYIDGLMKLLHPKTGKIHSSFNQTGTATGRLASRRPNLQNIPIKTNLGKKIRQAFIADKKANLLLSADYSQIELRMLAHLSGDKNLTSSFKEGSDIHRLTASLIFGQDQEKVSAQMRDAAKTVNFGIIYGMSAYGLSRDLRIKQEQAEEFIQAYFRRYPGVKKFIAHQIEQARAFGFVTTLLRRRRYIPQIKSQNEGLRQFAQRVAINAPVQGSASDLIKAAMIEIYRGIKTGKLSTRMLLQVHDELVFSVPQDELDQAEALIKDKMENAIRLKVPIKVSVKSGKNWLDMK